MKYRISKKKINEIIRTADIINVISEKVVLKKVGRNFVGLCPFHTEKTPSFTVSREKQVFYCFGCKEGGNVFSFLMKSDGLSFTESVSTIAARFGIKLPELKISKDTKQSETTVLNAINEDAMFFFHRNLTSIDGQHPVKAYLERRQITTSAIKKFKLGYAHQKWRSLENHLIREKHWSKKLVDISGLTVVKKDKNNSGSYDRFRERLIFPIHDVRNAVIGFGARVIDDSLPKYINSPQTKIYNKSNSLYGINITKEESRKRGKVFVVEGYLDLITLYQFGIKNSVATLGTAISTEHIRQIKEMVGRSGKIILVYDSDQAGTKAVYRSLKIFRDELDKLTDVKVMVLPLGYDPDAYIIEFGPEKFLEKSKEAIHPLSFVINLEINKNGSDVEGKMKTIRNMKSFIKADKDELSRALSIYYLAEKINIDPMIILKEVNTQRIKGENARNKVKEKLYLSGTILLELKIVTMILQFPKPKVISLLDKKDIVNKFKNGFLRNIANLAMGVSEVDENRLNSILEKCRDEKERALVVRLILSDDEWSERNCTTLIWKLEEEILKSKDKNLTKKMIEMGSDLSDEDSHVLLRKKWLLLKMRNDSKQKV